MNIFVWVWFCLSVHLSLLVSLRVSVCLSLCVSVSLCILSFTYLSVFLLFSKMPLLHQHRGMEVEKSSSSCLHSPWFKKVTWACITVLQVNIFEVMSVWLHMYFYILGLRKGIVIMGQFAKMLNYPFKFALLCYRWQYLFEVGPYGCTCISSIFKAFSKCFFQEGKK